MPGELSALFVRKVDVHGLIEQLSFPVVLDNLSDDIDNVVGHLNVLNVFDLDLKLALISSKLVKYFHC